MVKGQHLQTDIKIALLPRIKDFNNSILYANHLDRISAKIQETKSIINQTLDAAYIDFLAASESPD